MMRTVAHLMPFAALAGGILILVKPPLLNYVVALYLILVGAIGLNHMYHFIRETRSSSASGTCALVIQRSGFGCTFEFRPA
jgi:hypothetical protein